MKTGKRIKCKQLFIITLFWLFMGFIITIYDYLLVHTHISNGPAPEYSFLLNLIRNMGAGLIGAILGGSILVFYVNEKYRTKPYGYTIFIVCFSFILIVGIITLIMSLVVVPLQVGKPLGHMETQRELVAFITDTYPLKNGLAWFFIVMFTQIMLQVNSKFGHRTFWNILKGTYHMPRKEKRIFMFLDLDDSTTIAESLGNETYHKLLKDFFADITDPIIENKGNIYQYVGDEVVVAWDYRQGIEQAHCLQCFFDIKETLVKKEAYYKKHYGFLPSFKAGVHSGDVVAGEIGIIKRDVTYSGDVLNTTSRILGKCSELKEEIIISSDLLELLKIGHHFKSKLLGNIQLRGKQNSVRIHSLRLMPPSYN